MKTQGHPFPGLMVVEVDKCALQEMMGLTLEVADRRFSWTAMILLQPVVVVPVGQRVVMVGKVGVQGLGLEMTGRTLAVMGVMVELYLLVVVAPSLGHFLKEVMAQITAEDVVLGVVGFMVGGVGGQLHRAGVVEVAVGAAERAFFRSNLHCVGLLPHI